MAEASLSLRELNRATLARQLLLRRASLSAWNAIEWLGGLQAQDPKSPYIGLWTRLEHFEREDLSNAIEERKIVRAPLMRNTLHLTTSADYRMWRPALQPAMETAHRNVCNDIASRVDVEALVETARAFLADEPRSFPELREFLSTHYPEEDPACLAYTVRTYLPIVQVPPAGLWRVYGSPAYAVAEDWLGPSQVPIAEGLRHLVVRYLGAFGPASRQDIEVWAGMSHLGPVVDELMPALVTFQDETGHVLYDLPNAPRPDADVEAPPRFLPAYDNLLLSHADKRRVLTDEYRSRVFPSSGRMRPTFLVDGTVQGTWRIARRRGTASLHIEPFVTLSPHEIEALVDEGGRLLRFVEDEAEMHDVRLQDAESRSGAP